MKITGQNMINPSNGTDKQNSFAFNIKSNWLADCHNAWKGNFDISDKNGLTLSRCLAAIDAQIDSIEIIGKNGESWKEIVKEEIK